MERPLTLGFSPCPNDTFIFHALAEGLIPWPGGLEVTMADVEELNGLASAGTLDVVKVSVAAAADLLDEYVLLRAGGAMGYGAGPILVSRRPCALADLDGATVAIPGARTTANLLFGLCCRERGISVARRELVFDRIMGSVLSGEVDAGVIIHEGRFVYEAMGLCKVLDLGLWWEETYGLPIPLGAIAVRRSLGPDIARRINAAIRASLEHARECPADSAAYVREHAQEMDEEVVRRHIETFVTGYSLDVGREGEAAVTRLLDEARRMSGSPVSGRAPFIPA